MAAAIALREDYDGPVLRGLAKASKDANQTRRLLCPPVSTCAARIRFLAKAMGLDQRPPSVADHKTIFRRSTLLQKEA